VEKAIALNPKDPTNYYLLGRWCYGVSIPDTDFASMNFNLCIVTNFRILLL